MQPQAPQDLSRPVFMRRVDDAEAMRLKKNILGNGSGNPRAGSLGGGYDAYRLRWWVLDCSRAGRTMTPESRRFPS